MYFKKLLGCIIVLLAAQVNGVFSAANIVDIATKRSRRLPYTHVNLTVRETDQISNGRCYAGTRPKFGNYAEIVFDIETLPQPGIPSENVGDIVLLLFPEGHRTAYPVLELTILIGKSNSHHFPTEEDLALRKKGYGTAALETLFASLKKGAKSGITLPEGTVVKLDIEQHKPWLKDWYGKFGFIEQPTGPFSEFWVMTCPVKKLKFPLNKKRRNDAAFKIQQAWRTYKANKVKK